MGEINTEYIDGFINSQMRMLFIGPNRSSLIDRYRSWGAEAYGCNHSSDHPYTYANELKDIHFPTDYFDLVFYRANKVTPELLREIFRILKQIKQNGRFLFNSRKDIKNKAYSMFEEIGFVTECCVFSSESGTIIHARKPMQNRPKILVPPGIGDAYWVLVKLRAFLRHAKLDLPDVYAACDRDDICSSHIRGFPFLDMFPFINSTWESIPTSTMIQETGQFAVHPSVWEEAYTKPGRTIYPNVLGCDYFMAYNGYINNGHSLEEIDMHLDCEWFPPMFVSLKQKKAERKAQEIYGNYALFHFKTKGTYEYWRKYFPIAQVSQFINGICKELELTPILVGSPWDAKDAGIDYLLDNTDCVDMIGKTSLEELFGLLRSSKIIVGYPSGVTMFPPVLGCKSYVLWSDLYPEATRWNVVPPSTHNITYFADTVAGGIDLNNLIGKVKGAVEL